MLPVTIKHALALYVGPVDWFALRFSAIAHIAACPPTMANGQSFSLRCLWFQPIRMPTTSRALFYAGTFIYRIASRNNQFASLMLQKFGMHKDKLLKCMSNSNVWATQMYEQLKCMSNLNAFTQLNFAKRASSKIVLGHFVGLEQFRKYSTKFFFFVKKNEILKFS